LLGNLLHENIRDDTNTQKQVDQTKAVTDGQKTSREDCCSWHNDPTIQI